MRGWLARLARELEELLLPVVCARCGGEPAAGAVLCPACDEALPRLAAGSCALCQEAPPRPGEPGRRCGACAGEAGPLCACLAAAPYTGEPARFIRRFKYPRPGLVGLDPAAEAIAVALVREAAQRAPLALPDAVVPVPLHPARLRARGFQPAALLARALARHLRLPLASEALLRLRDTPSQTGLDRAARQRNVAGAFRATRALSGARLWLVDDVVTTGATLRAAGGALREAGAARVVGLAAARTLAAGPGVCPPRGEQLNEEVPRTQEPGMATLKQAISLKHRGNLGEEAEEVQFQAGQEVTVLKEWADSALCKNDDGLLFNIPKDHLE